MNFITPLLFVFYLQVMPPPPPTMHGGEDLQAGFVLVDIDGNSTQDGFIFGFIPRFPDFSENRLQRALQGIQALPGGWIGYRSIIDAYISGSLTLDFGDFRTLLNYVAKDSDEAREVCGLADEAFFIFRNIRSTSEYQNKCIDIVPITKELLFLSILSFLFIHYYHNREEFSNLTLFKK